MNLYLVQYDSQYYYVEAPGFSEAIDLWKGHVKKLWGDEYDGTEQPESVAHVHDEPVVRTVKPLVHTTLSQFDQLMAGEDPKEVFKDQTNDRATEALDLAVRYGSIDGAHHKDWVIDQMVRVLAGDQYARIVTEAKAGRDGPDTYSWSEGIAP